jgi:hypothetical protein
MKLKNKETQGIFQKTVHSLKKMCTEKPLEALKGITEVIGGVFSAGGAWYIFSNSREVNKDVAQAKALAIARQELIKLLDKNSDGEIGAYGLPKACDDAVKKLIFIPGGTEELKKIVEIFREFYVAKKQESNNQDQKVFEQQSGALAKMFFWKKPAI